MIGRDPSVASIIKPFSTGEEFVKDIDRYYLWVPNGVPAELRENPDTAERLDSVEETRAVSTKAPTRARAATPWQFDEVRYEGQGVYIGIPSVSPERGKHALLGFVRNGMVPGNILYFVSSESLLIFGVLPSQVHNAWVRTVAGRLKSDYRYANTIVYNSFVPPNPTPEQRDSIEQSAQGVLDARNLYSEASLAKLCGPDNEANCSELAGTHRLLDKAGERAYDWDSEGLPWDEKEVQIVSKLLGLYDQVVNSE